ncbi:MAG: thioredoxin family protein [Chthoniobacterales bacterium]
MKIFRALRAITALFAVLSTGCSRPAESTAAAGEVSSLWRTNYAEAQGEAKANQKLLLLDFTGSDWCGWCQKLKREVFETPEFQDYARHHLVLLEVDFPRRTELAAAQKMQNQLLAQQYRVQGFPTIVILDGDGNVRGALGYTPGGPSAFIAQLEKIRES